jgi:diamine N-acetyltransferase
MTEHSEPFVIRPARPGDEQAVHALVRELAEFERLLDQVVSTAADLAAAIFDRPPRLGCLLAEVAGAPAGTALFHPTFSTFTGRPGLWLEDVYVRPDHRRRGIGRALVDHFLDHARRLGCARAEWSVLDWNHHAIRFYEQLGAEVMPDWRIARVTLPDGR